MGRGGVREEKRKAEEGRGRAGETGGTWGPEGREGRGDTE
jgi:hypothetical protein